MTDDAMASRVEALEELLTEKGLIDPDSVDRLIDHFTHHVGPMNGAKVIARAWVDPVYRRRLLADGTRAIAEFGFDGPEAACIKVVENTPEVHNVVVCTLCSCYPWAVLGLPPSWYKSTAYRSRMVAEPRALLREMGLDLPAQVQIRVWDSSAEARFLVLPLRPDGTDNLSEADLARLVTRDAMIGVADVVWPGP
ncbi:MAG: nitrile hydratase subunit alpha [Mycobacterium sp.]